MKRWLLLGVIVSAVAVGLWWWQASSRPATAVSASITSLLAGENTAGFARATEPGGLQFPRDLGAHEAYQTEWWYYTGNLRAADGREFGYQFTIFRRALTPEPPADDSEWRSHQVYFAHFTISDIARGRFYQQEKFSRGGAGLAGARAAPYRVWIEDWAVAETAPGVVQISAQTGEVALDVALTQTLPPMLQGEAGLSQKGPEPGNASYYYSLVQQPTNGTLRLGEETVAVSGISWKDHEYSTSALAPDAVGWDWFSVQLENGTALMLVQIRQAGGGVSPFSAGAFVAAGGTTTPLAAGDFSLEVTDTWRSPVSGAEYPAGWEIRVPALDLTLTAVPLMPNQELTVSTVYWEGAVAYEGRLAGEPVSGRGYVELTGYATTNGP